MSTRYVCEKWNRNAVITYTENWSSFDPQGSHSSMNLTYNDYDGWYLNYSFDPSTGTVDMSDYLSYEDYQENSSYYYRTTVYWSATGYYVYFNGNPNNNKTVNFNRTQYFKRRLGYSGESKTNITSSTTYSKGTTSYGNITASSSSNYPNNNYSGSYWYVYKGSDSIDPTVSITPNPGKGGELVTINITPSTGNVYGGTIKYKVTYSLDSGSETVLNESTSETSLQLLVPKGTESLTVYVTASDNMGFTGDKISTTISIINNSDPVITSEISNLGSIDSIFNIPYSVSDEDGDNLSITEKIDKTVFRTFSTTSGNQNFTITDYQFLNITNDFHNIIIEADDGNGGTDTLTIPFTKALYTTTLALDSPMSTDGLVTKCYLTLTGNIPDDSELEILVSNNPYVTSPVWEDITNYVKNNWNYQFENTSVTSNQYGFDFKLTVSRGDSNTAGNIISISGGFE